MIDLSPQDLQVVCSILKQWIPDKKVAVFGSRVKGQAKPFSDLDLAIYSETPLSPVTLAHLRDAFSASSLPIKVDLIEVASVDEKFLAIIENEAEILQQG